MNDLKMPSPVAAAPGYGDDLVAWMENQIELLREHKFEQLRRELQGGHIGSRYLRVAKRASLQTGLPLSALPASCPYTVEQVLDQDFLP